MSIYDYLDMDKLFLNKDDVEKLEPMCAARTKPVKKAMAKKRAGAKATKKIERLQSLGHELDPEEATAFRGLGARANYLSQDRADFSFASKELCREFAIPNHNSFAKLKRLVRYLCGLPRLVYEYPFLGTLPTLWTYMSTLISPAAL